MAWKTFLVVALEYSEDPELVVRIRVKDDEGKSSVLSVKNCIPRFWTEKNPTELRLPATIKTKMSDYKSIAGVPLWEVRAQEAVAIERNP